MKAAFIVMSCALAMAAQPDRGEAILRRLNSQLEPLQSLKITRSQEHYKIIWGYEKEMFHLYNEPVIPADLAFHLTSALWAKPLTKTNLTALNRSIIAALNISLDCRDERCQLGKSQRFRKASGELFRVLRVMDISAPESIIITEDLLRAGVLIVNRAKP